MVNETIIRVRYQETDQMGVVYHSNYFVWYEIGRTEFLRELGLEYSVLEKEGLMLPVVDAGCKYKIPAKYDDEIIIRTKVAQLKSVKIKFEYEILRKPDRKIMATGYTIHAFASSDLKIINFEKNHSDIFDNILKRV